MKRHELTGQRFGKLLVVGLAEISRNGHSRWSCLCDCGGLHTAFATHLVRRKITHCGCSPKQKPRNFKGCGSVSSTYYNSLVRGASGGKGRVELDFNVSINYLSYLLDDVQKGQCVLTGLPISVRGRTASVDRIDSSKGYVEGNVWWTHKDINMMKRHYTVEYFKRLCDLVSKKSD